MKNIRILELFSGYGTASFALKNIGIEPTIVGYSDIDKYANQCFEQNHWKEMPMSGKQWEEAHIITGHRPQQLGDVRNINPNELPDFDLLTGGFPCQAFSVAGKGLGELDPRGTLFWEIVRIAEVKKPRWMLLENVKGLTNKKHKPTFEKILSELERIGYHVHWKVLNTRDFGIPQNRERVWFVCFRERDDYNKFSWPEKEELKLFIKDILEPEPVDEKYYLSEKAVLGLIRASKKQHKPTFLDSESLICPTIDQRVGATTHYAPYVVAVRQRDRHGKNEEKIQQPEPRLDGCSNSLTTVQKDNLIVVGSLSTEGWEKRFEEIRRVYDVNGIAPTIPTSQGGGVTPKIEVGDKIRRLTPKECFRLQGFLKDEINLEGLSNTQRYKLAGNGQTVTVVSKIFKEMFK